MLLPKLYQSKEEKHTPPEPKPVWVSLPVKIQLLLYTPLSCVQMELSLPLTPQEVHSLETRAIEEHLSLETAFVNYCKTIISEQEKMKEIVRQAQEKYHTRKQVVLDIQPLGQLTQDWSQV